MNRILYFVLAGVFFLSCSSQKTAIQNVSAEVISNEAVGIPKETSNPNTPFIYKNGYDKIEIVNYNLITKTDTLDISELRFNATFSAMYSKKVMFDNFGMWDEAIKYNKVRHPQLVWKEVLLFNDEKFTVVCLGKESLDGIYTSFIVKDSKGKNVLETNNSLRNELITYFSNKIQNLSPDRKFYDIYWAKIN